MTVRDKQEILWAESDGKDGPAGAAIAEAAPARSGRCQLEQLDGVGPADA